MGVQPVATGPSRFSLAGMAVDDVLAIDGIRLRAYSMGPRTARCLVFANALGLSAELLAPLMASLATTYRVITWDARLSPGPDGDPRNTSCTPEAFTADIGNILAHYDVAQAMALIGWCSGAEAALRFAQLEPRRLGALILFSPLIRGLGEVSEFSKRNQKIYERVLRRPEMAEVIARIMDPAHADLTGLQERNHTSDPEIARQIARPFASGPAILRHVVASHGLYQGPTATSFPLAGTEVPLLCLIGATDRVVDTSVAGTLVKAQSHVHAAVWEDPSGDHYLPCRPDRVEPVLRRFLQSHAI
jgi:pimeloyl-ACP methyl ester carboxylesterase